MLTVNSSLYLVGSDDDPSELISKGADRGSINYRVIRSYPNIKLVCRQHGLETLDGIGTCTNLEVLDCSYNCLPSLAPLNTLPHFRKLICRNSHITFKGFSSSLTVIDCRNNSLVSLVGLGACTNLEVLNCSDNILESLEGCYPCLNLRVIRCTRNRLTTIDGLGACTNLEKLYICDNKLVSLDGIMLCSKLRKLRVNCNRLTTLAGLELLTGLEVLNCSGNLLASIDIGSGSNLKKLGCGQRTMVTLQGSSVLSSLRKFDCTWSTLDNLKGLDRFPHLVELTVTSCKLGNLDGIEACQELQTVYCDRNNLVSLGRVGALVNLRELYCENNSLASLEGLRPCARLTRLFCNNNQIVSLDPIRSCVALVSLHFRNNLVADMSPIVYLRHLQCVNSGDNPLDIMTVQVQRFMERIWAMTYRGLDRSSIYGDSQNVHDSQVQRSVCESVQMLLKDPKPTVPVVCCVLNSDLDAKIVQTLIEYCTETTIHSVHLITYAELLSYVWARIMASDHRAELFKILTEQIADSECKCFTGRFNRTLSVLVGFSPDIVITISDRSRIGAIILAVKDTIRPYDADRHREAARIALNEADYGEEEVRAWLEAIE